MPLMVALLSWPCLMDTSGVRLPLDVFHDFFSVVDQVHASRGRQAGDAGDGQQAIQVFVVGVLIASVTRTNTRSFSQSDSNAQAWMPAAVMAISAAPGAMAPSCSWRPSRTRRKDRFAALDGTSKPPG